jgi:hypothetical protein
LRVQKYSFLTYPQELFSEFLHKNGISLIHNEKNFICILNNPIYLHLNINIII